MSRLQSKLISSFCHCYVLSYSTPSINHRTGKHLEGKWYNELGSSMNIESAESGMLKGFYNTKVGEAECNYVLTGCYDSLKNRRSLGWTVTWVNKDDSKSMSTTCWCGQYQQDPVTNEPYILTTWLLTTQTTPDYDWNSTHVSQDVFSRSRPSQDVIQKTKHQVRCSHPRESEV